MGRPILLAIVAVLLALPAVAESQEPDRGTYAVRVRDLEERVNRLKADYNRARYRLNLLAEKILDRTVGGASAQLSFRSEMGPLLDLERVVFTLDGELIYLKVDRDDELDEMGEISLYDGPLPPGDHVLGVTLEYRGQGLPYVDGYFFRVRSSHVFTVDPGQSLELDIVGYEKGKLDPITERPSIRFIERISDDE